MTKSLLVSTGAVSNAVMLPALMMNFIWFTDKKLFIVSALTQQAWNTVSHKETLNHLARSVRWCIVLLKCAKVKIFPIGMCIQTFCDFFGLQWQNLNNISNQIKSNLLFADTNNHRSVTQIGTFNNNKFQMLVIRWL